MEVNQNLQQPKAILCHIISHVSCIFIASYLFNLIFLKHFTQNQFNSLHTDIRNFLCNILLRNWNNCSKQNTLNSFGFFAFLREISVNDSSKSLKHRVISLPNASVQVGGYEKSSKESSK